MEDATIADYIVVVPILIVVLGPLALVLLLTCILAFKFIWLEFRKAFKAMK